MEDRYFFKAKRMKYNPNEETWVIGSYVHTNDGDYIVVPYKKSTLLGEGKYIEVVPETVCQCTGLKDKNGKLIWENDIVRDEHGNFYKAIWQNNYYQFSWICVKSDVFPIGAKWDLWSIKSFEIEVVGNIFDNPELGRNDE